MQRIVLSYSGGLDTALAIPWLKKASGAEIIAVTLDVGQRGELVEVRERALALGATRCHVIDAREEFVRGYIQHALQADALDRDGSPMASALSRPLIVGKLVDVAKMEGATAVAHGAIAGSRDERRIERLLKDVDPMLEVLTPARTWELSTREQKIDFARSLGVAIPVPPVIDYKVDSNLWGRTIAPASQRTRALAPDDELFALTSAPEDCPDQPAYILIEFDAGVATRANGIEMLPLEMLESLDIIAGTHGVGRIGAGASGPDAGTMWEAPSAIILHTAHRELQKRVTDAELQCRAAAAAREYAEIIEEGRWFSADRATLDAFVSSIQGRVSGSIQLRLFKGQCSVVDRPAPEGTVPDRDASTGTIINSY